MYIFCIFNVTTAFYSSSTSTYMSSFKNQNKQTKISQNLMLIPKGITQFLTACLFIAPCLFYGMSQNILSKEENLQLCRSLVFQNKIAIFYSLLLLI